MDVMTKRNLMFLIGCIGVRTAIAYISKYVGDDQTLRDKYLPLFGYIALIPAIGFSYIYLTDSRKTGAEVFGGEIWWNDLRPIHAALYATFAMFAIKKNPNAWIVLAIDVVIGLGAFIINRLL